MLSPTLTADIKFTHLQQLAELVTIDYGIPAGGDIPEVEEETLTFTKEEVIDWVKNNPKAIQAAKDAQMKSPSLDKPNWDVMLFALIESAAMYLRKRQLMVKAAVLYASDDEEKKAQAVGAYEEAQQDVNEIAEALGCEFYQICDLSRQAPDSALGLLSGAYCGAFICKDTGKPFTGVAFKGTTPSNWRELTTDGFIIPQPGLQDGVAWGAQIHGGFNYGLFGSFKVKTPSGTKLRSPFDMILSSLKEGYHDTGGAQVHVTGHSLGGAYSTLLFGEFLRRQHDDDFKNLNIGDMYSFGAPRCGLQPFARNFAATVERPFAFKYPFRIVNKDDPVTTVPPVVFPHYPYVHIDGAWEISSSGAKKMRSEQGKEGPLEPKSIPEIWVDAPNHSCNEYYNTWKALPHS